jgi:hypothetical protein
MKKNYLWLIFVTVLVVGLMFSNLFVHAQEIIAETQWEYKIVYAKNKDSMKKQVKQDQPVLSALGMQGWELVTVQYNSNYYFKRKIKK